MISFLPIYSKAQNLDQVIKLIHENVKKSSVYLVENRKNTIRFNPNQMMHLASVAKTIIAIELPIKLFQKRLNPKQKLR